MNKYEFLANINDLFKPALNQGQQKFYGEFLQPFSEKQLDELWQITMRTHIATSPPTIGKLTEYAKEVSRVVVVNAVEKKKNEQLALTDEQILSTKMGRISLRQGWADSYMVHCRRHGFPDESTLIDFQKAQHLAEEGYKELEIIKDEGGVLNMAPSLINYRNSMRQKNRDIREKYRSLWDTNFNKQRA